MQKIPKHEFMAIFEVEQEANRFVDQILPSAKQRLSQAESELAAAKTNVAQVEGAIQGAQIMIQGLLEKKGFTAQQYVEQRNEHVKALAAANEGTRTLDEIIGDGEETQPQTPVELVKDNGVEPEIVKPPAKTKKKARGQ